MDLLRRTPQSTNWLYEFGCRVACSVGVDRRTEFYDLASMDPQTRSARGPIIQFYSGVANIGNYLPVLGIRKMLGRQTDLWDIHDDKIDFDFINQTYKCAIIGGAGLLHAAFQDFWAQFKAQCEIPYVVWGVGGCFPDGGESMGVSLEVTRPVLDEAALVNLRDDLTADHYGLKSYDLSPCPTVAYLRSTKVHPQEKNLLYSSHTGLISEQEQEAIYRAIENTGLDFIYTDNIETPLDGLENIVDRYARSSLVVTTRLHGAIIAYALGVPYIALARDEKIRAFNRLYGNGLLIETVGELVEVLEDEPYIELGPIRYDLVREFGVHVEDWLESEGVMPLKYN